MAITWNVVNRTGEPLEAVNEKLRADISRLEKLLAHFPEDALHLQIVFPPRRRDKQYPVTLNLRVPSDVLHVSRHGPAPSAAVHEAIAVMAGRLERLKSRYSRDHAWKEARRTTLPEKAAAFTKSPLVEGASPQTVEELVKHVLDADYSRILGFVRRHLSEYVRSGTVPRGSVDAREIAQSVAEKVLADPQSKPDSMDYYTWCVSLAFRLTRDAVRGALEEQDLVVPVDLDVALEDSEIAQEGVEPQEFALNLLRRKLEPDEGTLADTIPDPHAESPDAHLVEREVVEGMRKLVRSWPRLERQIFEMHFLEGFSTDDLASMLECDAAVVERALEQVRARLRTRLADQTMRNDAGSGWDEADADSKAGKRSDPRRRRARDAATIRTRTEFDALLIAMRRLESSLGSAAPHREQAWTARVRDDFRAVHSALERHAESASSADGLYSEIRLARPDMDARIAELERGQQDLARRAAELEKAVAEDSETPDFASIRRRAADLLLMIRHQHAQEVDLVYEAFWEDLGGSE